MAFKLGIRSSSYAYVTIESEGEATIAIYNVAGYDIDDKIKKGDFVVHFPLVSKSLSKAEVIELHDLSKLKSPIINKLIGISKEALDSVIENWDKAEAAARKLAEEKKDSSYEFVEL